MMFRIVFLTLWLPLVLASVAFPEKRINDVLVQTTLEELVAPAQTAVLVIDMQNEIVSTQGSYRRSDRKIPADPQQHSIAPAYQKQVARIQELLALARARQMLVIYCEYIHRDRNGKMLVNGPEVWTHRRSDWVSCAVEGSWAAETIPELAPHPGDLVIRKARSNAFYQTYLEDVLRAHSIRNVLLTGTAGGGCVFATAMGAMERGYYAVFVKDCCDQHHYLESDLIRGRFPIYSLDEVQATWQH